LTDLALKSARIVDFCGKSSGLADFGNTVDRGLAVYFDMDSGLRMSLLPIFGAERNLDQRSFFSLVVLLMSSSKLSFMNEAHLNSVVSLLLELFSFVLYYSHEICCLLY